jgi:predicted transcriptional regulator
MDHQDPDLVALAGGLVAAYVENNEVSAQDLPSLIGIVHAALRQQMLPKEESAPQLVPAVSVKKSVTPDYIVCLEDGKKFKSLKRHLRSAYGMTPDEYRAKWRLPADYPMVAPAYAATRSELAKAMGLGVKRKGKAAVAKPSPKGAKRRRRAAA